MVDYPTIIAQMDFWEALGEDQIRAVLQRAIQQLPSEQQDIVMSLDRSTGGGLVQDILNTNIFGIELDGVMHMGLYPLSSVSSMDISGEKGANDILATQPQLQT